MDKRKLESEYSGIWNTAIFYQLLLQTVMRLPDDFEQIERLTVLLLVELLLENGGRLQWPLVQIREEVGISDAALNRTIKKLLEPDNPLRAFVQARALTHINGAKRQSYELALVDWEDDQQSEEPSLTYISVPLPTSLVSVLPQIFAHALGEPLWQTEQQIDDLVIQVRVLRPRKNQTSDTPLPHLDLATALAQIAQAQATKKE